MIREQGVTFAIVIVKKFVVDTRFEAGEDQGIRVRCKRIREKDGTGLRCPGEDERRRSRPVPPGPALGRPVDESL